MYLPTIAPSILLALLQSITAIQALNIPSQPLRRSLSPPPSNTTVSAREIGENLPVICASNDRTPTAEITKHIEYFRSQQNDGKRPPPVDTWTCLREGCSGGSATWWCNSWSIKWGPRNYNDIADAAQRIIDQCADEEGKVSGSVYLAGADPSGVRKGGWSVELWEDENCE